MRATVPAAGGSGDKLERKGDTVVGDDAQKTAERFAGRRRATVAEAAALLTVPGGERFVKVLEHGSMEVELYAPRGVDGQTPHSRDELYVVVSGSGEFVNGPERHPFGPGDVLFVPAGVEHRFEGFTDDFAVWVVFYGPEGGEAALRGGGRADGAGER